jgi:hypothetical protein
MAKNEDPFADPSVGNGQPNQYEIDLSSLPRNAVEDTGPEDPEWDLNATELPRRAPSDTSPEYAEEPEQSPAANRPERFDPEGSNEREFGRSERPGRAERPSRRGPMPFEDREEDNEEVDDEDSDQLDDSDSTSKFAFLSKLNPKPLVDKFQGLDKKKKIMVAGAAVILLIIVIVIIVSAIGSIASALSSDDSGDSNKPKPSASASVSPTTEPSAKPVPEDTNTWEPSLAVKVGETGVTIDGVEMTAQSVKCDVAVSDSNGAPLESKEGAWCQLDFDAKNVSNSVITLNSQRFSLTATDGTVYTGNGDYANIGGNVIAKLASDESLSGSVYFAAPAATKASSVQMSTFGNAGGGPIIVSISDAVAPAPAPIPAPAPSTPAEESPSEEPEGDSPSDEPSEEEGASESGCSFLVSCK